MAPGITGGGRVAAGGVAAGDRGETAQRAGQRPGWRRAGCSGAQAAAAQGHHVHRGRQHGVWDQSTSRWPGARWTWPGSGVEARASLASPALVRDMGRLAWRGRAPVDRPEEHVIAVDAAGRALQHGLGPGPGLRLLSLQRLQGHPGPRLACQPAGRAIHCGNAYSVP